MTQDSMSGFYGDTNVSPAEVPPIQKTYVSQKKQVAEPWNAKRDGPTIPSQTTTSYTLRRITASLL